MMKLYLGGFIINFLNIMETFSIYKDIFFFQEYKFHTIKKAPFIIDCGSHIGVSVLYFKKKHPNAAILSFEANPKTFSILKKNIEENHLKNIKLINRAVGLHNGKIPFYISAGKKKLWNWGDAGVKNFWYNNLDYNTIDVHCVKLSKYIDRPVDLIKMDVEGMESIILEEIKNKLKYVKELIMEFHKNPNNQINKLEDILRLLKKAGFECKIKHPSSFLHLFRKEVNLDDVVNLDFYFLIIHAKKI